LNIVRIFIAVRSGEDPPVGRGAGGAGAVRQGHAVAAEIAPDPREPARERAVAAARTLAASLSDSNKNPISIG